MRRVVLPAAMAVAASLLIPSAVDAAAAATVCDVSGRVLDADGDAVPTVGVRFHSGSGDAESKANANGAFSFRTACGSNDVALTWWARPATGLPKVAALRGSVKVTDGGRYVFRLPTAVTATLKVVDTAGKPVVGALVHPTDEEEMYFVDDAKPLTGGSTFKVTVEPGNPRTDATGKASILTFPDHDMHVTVSPPSGSPLELRRLVLDATTSVTKQLVLSTTPDGVPQAVTVRTVDGRAVPGLRMRLPDDTKWRTTDAEGRYIGYSRAGQTLLHGASLTADGEPVALLPDLPPSWNFRDLPVTVGSGAPIDITLPPTSHVRLSFKDPGGGYLSRPVTMHTNSVPAFYSDPTVLTPGTAPRALEVAIPHTLSNWGLIEFDMFRTSTLKGLRLSWTNDHGDEQFLNLGTLDLTGDLDREITLPAAPPKHVVTGSLTDFYGKTLPAGFRLSVLSQTATVGADGRFTMSVPEGRSSMHIARADYNPGWVPSADVPGILDLTFPIAVSGPGELNLRLPRLHEVTVRALDPEDRNPVKGATLRRTDPFKHSGLTVAGAAGPASGSVTLWEPPTNAAGETSFRLFSVASADIELWGRYDGADLRSEVLDLEVTGDKALTLVLGTSQRPTKYQRPGEVTDVTAEDADAATASAHQTVTPTSALVRWKPPARTGGMKIQGYQVTAMPGGKTARFGASVRKATIAGLTRGTRYTFTVRAVNAVGPATARPVRLDVAAPRVTLKAGSVRGGSARIIWSGTDDASGVASFDVRVGKRLVLKNTVVTKYRLAVPSDGKICASVRARDRVGHVGAWSSPQCFRRR